ncbi:unnamed protein product [Peronospora destructor]|uniref:Uncharacterized protein n=1 Tax=Peronospora destructor TaxID=86335 RepID=A0AAV0VCI9_9STRA|nr:unnamed protein product [Peronospora destructor]
MTFSSTLQLQIFGGHSLDNATSSPRRLADKDGDNNADLKLRCLISGEGKRPSFRREDFRLEGTQNTGASNGLATSLSSALQGADTVTSLSSGFQSSGLSGPLTIPVSTNGNEAYNHSDWNMISSNSFDDTYLEDEYANGGMPLGSATVSSPLNQLNEPMNNLALESEDHDLPVISMPYPGTSWFMSGKTESGTGNAFSLLAFGGLTSRTQAVSTGTTENSATFRSRSCTPSFNSGGADFPVTIGKLPGDVVSCPSDDASPVQMESFAPWLPHSLEPSELLFEDINTWTGASADIYDNQYYHQQHSQPFFNASSSQTVSNGYPYFESTPDTTRRTMSALHQAYAPSYQRHPLFSSVSTASPLYQPVQSHEETLTATNNWTTNQVRCHSTPSTARTLAGELESSGVRVNANDHGNYRSNASESLRGAEEGHTIRRLLQSSKLDKHDVHLSTSGAVLETGSLMTEEVMPLLTTSPVAPNQSSKIQLLTALNNCYWKNGRKNLQCFPSCPEHHDFYSMKMNNRKHSSVGVCRGPVYCHAFTKASEFLPATSTQQMKRESNIGVPCEGSSAREIFILGRFERVPQKESTNLLEDLSAPPSFPNAALFEQFQFTCFQAVEMEERRLLLPKSPHDPSTETADSPNSKSKLSGSLAHAQDGFIRSTWFFLPDVWKVHPMLKKKRKATRSAPAQTFPFCFRIFIYTRNIDGPDYSCIADTASTFFELFSTRTVDRVKRKYWSSEVPSKTTNQRSNKQRGLQRL